MNALVNVLEEYAKQWSDVYDSMYIEVLPFHISLRLVRGNRDFVITCDRRDYQIYIRSSTRMITESNEDWINSTPIWGREYCRITDFVREKYPAKVDMLLEKLVCSIDVDNIKKVLLYLDENRMIIDQFLRHRLLD